MMKDGEYFMRKTLNLNNGRLWNKYFSLIFVVGFLSQFINFTITAIMPLYVAKIGGNNTSAGLLVTVFSIAALIFRPILGNLLDTKGRRSVLFAGFIILITISFLYNFAYTIGFLIILRAIHGIGMSSVSTAPPTIVTDITPKQKLSEGLSIFNIAANLAIAVGPILALYALKSYGFSAIFFISSIVGVIGLVLTLLINYEKKDKKKSEDKKLHDKKGLKLSDLFEKTAIKPSLVIFFLALSTGSIFNFIPAFGVSLWHRKYRIFFTLSL